MEDRCAKRKNIGLNRNGSIDSNLWRPVARRSTAAWGEENAEPKPWPACRQAQAGHPVPPKCCRVYSRRELIRTSSSKAKSRRLTSSPTSGRNRFNRFVYSFSRRRFVKYTRKHICHRARSSSANLYLFPHPPTNDCDHTSRRTVFQIEPRAVHLRSAATGSHRGRIFPDTVAPGPALLPRNLSAEFAQGGLMEGADITEQGKFRNSANQLEQCVQLASVHSVQVVQQDDDPHR